MTRLHGEADSCPQKVEVARRVGPARASGLSAPDGGVVQIVDGVRGPPRVPVSQLGGGRRSRVGLPGAKRRRAEEGWLVLSG